MAMEEVRLLYTRSPTVKVVRGLQEISKKRFPIHNVINLLNLR
jgi:hypothetical protein